MLQPCPRRIEFRAKNKTAVGPFRFGHLCEAINPVGNTGQIAIGQVISVRASFTWWLATTADADNFIAKTAAIRINPLQHLGSDQTSHMAAAKTGCAPDIQLFA